MTAVDWLAWQWDTPTAAWAAWILWFVVWESWALAIGQPEHTATWHLRPFFLSHPLTWFLAFGSWLWIGVHFLAPRFEAIMFRGLVGGS